MDNANVAPCDNVTIIDIYNLTSSITTITSTVSRAMENVTTGALYNTTEGHTESLDTVLNDTVVTSTMDNFTDTPTGYNVTSSQITSTIYRALENVTTGALYNTTEGHTESYDNTTGGYTDDYYYENYIYEYTEIIYQGFRFEAPIYLYVWGILVFLTSIVNIAVVRVLTRKNMHSVTNMILVAIAVSDSLTGLVTLPSYIAVYQRLVPPIEFIDHLRNESYQINSSMPTYYDSYVYPDTTANVGTHESHTGYALSPDLCRSFMISKLYISKVFHTVSIWLTLFLGVQRYICVAFPFKAQSVFTPKITCITIAIIVVLAPVLHVYHLVDDKVNMGLCSWNIGGCKNGACVYLWFAIIIMHFIPCGLLVICTCLFIKELHCGSSRMIRNDSVISATAIKMRKESYRRITIIVTAIVVVFLIPEIPYAVFLAYSTIRTQANVDILSSKSNRAFHAAYELLLVLSFHANFYIYTCFNQRFRRGLKRTFVYPIWKLLGRRQTMSVSRASSVSAKVQTAQTEGGSSFKRITSTELQPLQHKEMDIHEKSADENNETNRSTTAPVEKQHTTLYNKADQDESVMNSTDDGTRCRLLIRDHHFDTQKRFSV